jgi:hypothetical protein
MKDPQFLADAKKQDLSVDAITGQEIADIIAAVYKTPKDIVKRTSEALGRAGKDEKAN